MVRRWSVCGSNVKRHENALFYCLLGLFLPSKRAAAKAAEKRLVFAFCRLFFFRPSPPSLKCLGSRHFSIFRGILMKIVYNSPHAVFLACFWEFQKMPKVSLFRMPQCVVLLVFLT
jgi:hypothetical protein